MGSCGSYGICLFFIKSSVLQKAWFPSCQDAYWKRIYAHTHIQRYEYKRTWIKICWLWCLVRSVVASVDNGWILLATVLLGITPTSHPLQACCYIVTLGISLFPSMVIVAIMEPFDRCLWHNMCGPHRFVLFRNLSYWVSFRTPDKTGWYKWNQVAEISDYFSSLRSRLPSHKEKKSVYLFNSQTQPNRK